MKIRCMTNQGSNKRFVQRLVQKLGQVMVQGRGQCAPDKASLSQPIIYRFDSFICSTLICIAWPCHFTSSVLESVADSWTKHWRLASKEASWMSGWHLPFIEGLQIDSMKRPDSRFMDDNGNGWTKDGSNYLRCHLFTKSI